MLLSPSKAHGGSRSKLQYALPVGSCSRDLVADFLSRTNLKCASTLLGALSDLTNQRAQHTLPMWQGCQLASRPNVSDVSVARRSGLSRLLIKSHRRGAMGRIQIFYCAYRSFSQCDLAIQKQRVSYGQIGCVCVCVCDSLFRVVSLSFRTTGSDVADVCVRCGVVLQAHGILRDERHRARPPREG